MTGKILIAALLGMPAVLPAQTFGPEFPFRFDRIAAPLSSLTDADRRRIDAAVDLIRRGEHLAAFAPLADLSNSNPNNSGVRLLAAYAALQIGNLAGAFDHAKAAEKAPNHSSYSCLLLARIAAWSGDAATCRRELKHVQGEKEFAEEAQMIRSELESRTKRKRP